METMSSTPQEVDIGNEKPMKVYGIESETVENYMELFEFNGKRAL
jgi:hypothetical protein